MLMCWHLHFADIQDPWWNPAVEEQAIMRIHRIGQKREVRVKRFIVKVSDGFSILLRGVICSLSQDTEISCCVVFVLGHCRGADATGPNAQAEDGFWGAH